MLTKIRAFVLNLLFWFYIWNAVVSFGSPPALRCQRSSDNRGLDLLVRATTDQRWRHSEKSVLYGSFGDSAYSKWHYWSLSTNNVIYSKQLSIAWLAQSVEHETLNLRVVGSSPTLGFQIFLYRDVRAIREKCSTQICIQLQFSTFSRWLLSNHVMWALCEVNQQERGTDIEHRFATLPPA
jgi:hypothetical protein